MAVERVSEPLIKRREGVVEHLSTAITLVSLINDLISGFSESLEGDLSNFNPKFRWGPNLSFFSLGMCQIFHFKAWSVFFDSYLRLPMSL